MNILDKYNVFHNKVRAEVLVIAGEDFVNLYSLQHTKVKDATNAALNYLRERIIEGLQMKVSELLNPLYAEAVKEKITNKARELIKKELSGLDEEEEEILIGKLIQEMLGLGELEFVIADENLEEIVINSSKEPVWVYHKKYGWLKTNIKLNDESQIYNYATIIGRKVGKQITNLEPLMDAHLTTGDRVNATLFPISTKGNSITIRKFATEPWTIVHLIENKTLSAEVAALIWLSLQYEMNMLVGGGTASGKTSILNSMLIFTPANQRIISIEDTRELVLPEFLHWTPMSTRQPNPEGKGEVTMLDLMVNSLRMRPDRIVLGEIRRQREAEVLFEAMHTGHAVYATLHAETSVQVKNRLVNPPISVSETLLEALHLVAIQYRQRRAGIRRMVEIAEIVPTDGAVATHVVFKWNPRTDTLEKIKDFIRFENEVELHTGFTKKEIKDDLQDKEKILNNLVTNKLSKINSVGRVVAEYYRNPSQVISYANKNKNLNELIS